MSFPATILTRDLHLLDVPDENAEMKVINRFALTLDSSEALHIELERQDWKFITDESSLVLLRSRLYLEQRRWSHFGRPIDGATESEY